MVLGTLMMSSLVKLNNSARVPIDYFMVYENLTKRKEMDARLFYNL